MWARITHADPEFVFVPVTKAASARTAQVLRVVIIIKLVKITRAKPEHRTSNLDFVLRTWCKWTIRKSICTFGLFTKWFWLNYIMALLWRERNKQYRNHTKRFVARKPSTVRPLECCFLWLPCLRESVPWRIKLSKLILSWWLRFCWWFIEGDHISIILFEIKITGT